MRNERNNTQAPAVNFELGGEVQRKRAKVIRCLRALEFVRVAWAAKVMERSGLYQLLEGLLNCLPEADKTILDTVDVRWREYPNGSEESYTAAAMAAGVDVDMVSRIRADAISLLSEGIEGALGANWA